MDEIAKRLATVRARIARAEESAGRPPGSVELLAVSKTRPAADIARALHCGQRRFGESYVQEALDKISALADRDIDWHFIGPIQTNKTRAIAENFDWVHSIDRLKVARRLSEQRPADRPPLNVCLQVNISGETRKAGASPAEAPTLARAIAALPGLHLRGLMTIPAPESEPARQRQPFRALRELFDRLRAEGLTLDTLSMGMSDDLEAAIAEGATLVRIGTAVFGERPRRPA
ncbi:MAG TPA: YggS family pyridoxal phosphate-dependent enzyme [Gammaproteobacteria bacterium]|nr:YggS family pyridoxal phosphate-dependent enzyme [Gammaproteobacteria bacterium]